MRKCIPYAALYIQNRINRRVEKNLAKWITHAYLYVRKPSRTANAATSTPPIHRLEQASRYYYHVRTQVCTYLRQRPINVTIRQSTEW